MKQIIIADIKAQLEAGKSRKEISLELELNPREQKSLWKHPSLLGIKKSKYKDELVFVEEVKEATLTIPFPTGSL